MSTRRPSRTLHPTQLLNLTQNVQLDLGDGRFSESACAFSVRHLNDK